MMTDKIAAMRRRPTKSYDVPGFTRFIATSNRQARSGLARQEVHHRPAHKDTGEQGGQDSIIRVTLKPLMGPVP